MTETPESVAPEAEATQEAIETTEDTKGEQKAETPDEPDGESPETAEDAEKKSRNQRRREARERMEQELSEAKQRATAAERALAALQETTASTPKPQETDFASYEEYQAALSGWHAIGQVDARERARLEREHQSHKEALQRAEQAERQAVNMQWGEQVTDAKTRYADFEQVAFTSPISDQVAHMIAQMDGGADVAYHLGQNHAEAQRISKLSPVNAAMELARLEARVMAPKAKPLTQTPDPITPVKAKASASKDPEKMSMAEYRAARAAGKI